MLKMTPETVLEIGKLAKSNPDAIEQLAINEAVELLCADWLLMQFKLASLVTMLDGLIAEADVC